MNINPFSIKASHLNSFPVQVYYKSKLDCINNFNLPQEFPVSYFLFAPVDLFIYET